MQFLYEKLYSEPTEPPVNPNKDLFCDVLKKNHGEPVTIKQFAYGKFALFHGPRPTHRTDDPGEGIERHHPRSFPQARWDALQDIGTALETILMDATKTVNQAALLTTCAQALQRIVADDTRTVCFKEPTVGETWEEDPAKLGSYRLRP